MIVPWLLMKATHMLHPKEKDSWVIDDTRQPNSWKYAQVCDWMILLAKGKAFGD